MRLFTLIAISAMAGAGFRLAFLPVSKPDKPRAGTYQRSSSSPANKAKRPQPTLATLAGTADLTTRLELELDFLDETSAADVSALAEQRLADPTAPPIGWDPIFQRWFELDPAAAIAFARVKPDEPRAAIDERLTAAFAAWLEVDKAAAVAAATSEPEQIIVIDLLSSFDPALGYRLLQAASPALRLRFSELLPSYYKAGLVAEQDFEGSAEQLRQQGQKSTLELEALIESWAIRDPAGAIGWCESSLGSREGALQVGKVFEVAARNDPSTAINLLGSIQSARLHAIAAGGIGEVLAEGNPAAARAWIDTLPDRHISKNVAISRAAWAIARTDSLGALRLLAEYADQLSPYNLQEIGADPTRALGTEQPGSYQFPNGSMLYDFIGSGLLDELAAERPIDYLRLYDQLPDSLKSDSDPQVLVTQLARVDRGAAERWIERVPAGTVRESMKETLMAFDQREETE